MAAIAYFILQQRITAAWAPTLLRAVGRDWKGKISPALYFIGIISAQWSPTGAKLIYLGVAFFCG